MVTERIEAVLRDLDRRDGLRHTWTWLGDQMGISNWRIGRLKRGGDWRHREAWAAVDVLGVRYEDLFGGEAVLPPKRMNPSPKWRKETAKRDVA